MHELGEIQATLGKGDLADALHMLNGFLKRDPENLEGLYLHAVTCRYLRNYEAALGSIDQLKRLSPAYSRAHQEEGHAFRDLGKDHLALQAYLRALALNSALEASLREAIRLSEAMGQNFQAQALSAQLDSLLELPEPLRSALDLVSQNKLLKAEALVRRFLTQHPQHVQGMRLLADIGGRLGVLEDAEFLLESAASFAPNDLQIQMEYVQILRKRQKFAVALQQAKALLLRHPENPQVKSLNAIEHMQTGDYDTAITLLDEVLAQVPGDARTLVTYGHALKTAGRAAAAIEKYRDAMANNPEHGESYYSLANLKTYQFEEDDVAKMRSLEQNGNLGFMDRVYINFALAKACEDRDQFEIAFSHYAKGNALKKAQSRYDADKMREEFDQIKTVCSKEFFTDREGYGSTFGDPIFILGLPRAGSTLLEQILSSHSQIDGTLELPNILSLSQQLRRRNSSPGYPAVLAELTREECSTFGEAYIEDTRIHRSAAPMFVDKMPNNFRHIGLIKLILPNAKIIDARRDPMACCFSGFKQLFAEGQEFSYGLSDLGRYYSDYVNLMSHWERVLPGHVLRVQHEDVVADLETEVRRMLSFCGLPYEEGCIRFFETERNVRTPSSEQVRQPIFTDSLDQWRRFEPWLEPLKETLAAGSKEA